MMTALLILGGIWFVSSLLVSVIVALAWATEDRDGEW